MILKESNRRADAILTAIETKNTRFPEAKTIFVAGSIIRGTDTPHSDIDLVVIFGQLPYARRESFILDGFPIEAFIHDPQTIRYFFEEVDAKSGCPSLPHMVSEGVAIPDDTFSQSLKNLANEVLCKGPPPLTQDNLNSRRYSITDFVDDLRAPRNIAEATASGTRLYEVLADFYLRANGQWSANGKAIPRVLKKYNPDFAKRFIESFQLLFQTGDASGVIRVSEDALDPFGGLFFDGYKITAPETWRVK